MNKPDLSVVIPVYNRGAVLHYAFESVRRAAEGLTVETVVVDDGSTPPAAETLGVLGIEYTKLLRQENRGLLFARLAGLAAASGRYVLFLDSDDLLSVDKLTAQINAMDGADADVSYTDTARTTLTGNYDDLAVTFDPPTPSTSDAAELFISIQPAPHSPVFRRTYLEQVVATACFAPSPLYNPVAEIWFYHVAALHPARVVYVSGPRAIVGQHSSFRLTNQWERLGVASLAVMEAFARHCPSNTPQALRARRLVGEKAFRSWRALPHDFLPEFRNRLLALWRRLGEPAATAALGGRSFQLASRVMGPVAAGHLFRRWRNASHASCRALDDAQIAGLLAALPPPQ